ncbi:MAG: 5-formyltetrahydrofolate cyclo-ligase [Gammaproteobacteria bacterium]|nr:5-formyltetrahydrofolate cyclo-ligase [Gammaproteobacteria bacterium]
MADIDAQSWDSVRRWRVRQRRRLVEQRLALSAAERAQLADAIIERLAEALHLRPGDRAGFYWPLRGEPDLRPYVRRLLERGVTAALPVVVEQGRPLEFWHWDAGTKMRRQEVWGIPVPAERIPTRPTVLLIPLVGYDGSCHRLGHGGGYYDRTLAALEPRPLAIGVGLAQGRLQTIHPQPHDVPMDVIVTENETLRREARP